MTCGNRAFGGLGGGYTSFGAKALYEAGRAFAHGVAQGSLSMAQGGSFKNGFASGALGSLGGSAFGAVGGKFAKSGFGMTSFGVLSGGIGAELSGGDFWRGAGTGATVALLNHFGHQGEGNLQEKRAFKKKYSLDGISLADLIEAHIVQEGETLWGIANRTYGGGYSVKEILKYNPNIKYQFDSNGDYVPIIHPGQEIIMPKGFMGKTRLNSGWNKILHVVKTSINIAFDYFMKPTLGPVIPELMRDNQFNPNESYEL